MALYDRLMLATVDCVTDTELCKRFQVRRCRAEEFVIVVEEFQTAECFSSYFFIVFRQEQCNTGNPVYLFQLELLAKYRLILQIARLDYTEWFLALNGQPSPNPIL